MVLCQIWAISSRCCIDSIASILLPLTCLIFVEILIFLLFCCLFYVIYSYECCEDRKWKAKVKYLWTIIYMENTTNYCYMLFTLSFVRSCVCFHSMFFFPVREVNFTCTAMWQGRFDHVTTCLPRGPSGDPKGQGDAIGGGEAGACQMPTWDWSTVG